MTQSEGRETPWTVCPSSDARVRNSPGIGCSTQSLGTARAIRSASSARAAFFRASSCDANSFISPIVPLLLLPTGSSGEKLQDDTRVLEIHAMPYGLLWHRIDQLRSSNSAASWTFIQAHQSL